eukprot:TRINITY_DN67341_c0_g2_i2.p1 TRINITY_DN67341_c0_g2~~TRINITY_DN67341_c0_g2_i2.p1  ORF type:complete len:326 (-),score=31.28 TRINITY_DN67341_c0_g2_i2:53-1030(-)
MKTPRRAAHFGYLCRREFTAVEVFITTPSGSRCASTAVVDGVGSPQSLLLGNNVHLTCNESGTSTTCCEHDDDGSVVITLEIPQWGVILTNFSVDFDENDGPTTKPNLPNGPATKSLLDDVGCVIGQDVVQPLLLLDILRWPTYCAKKFEHQTSKHTTAVTLDWDQLSLFRYLCKEIFTDWQSPANLTPASHQQPENTIFDLQPRSCTGNTWWVWDELDDDVDYVVPATAGRQTTPWWCSSQQGTTNTRTTPLSWSWTSLLCCVAPPRQHQEHQPAKAKVYTTLDGPVLGYIEESMFLSLLGVAHTAGAWHCKVTWSPPVHRCGK